MRSLRSDGSHTVHGAHRSTTFRVSSFDAPTFSTAPSREATDAQLLDAYARAEAAGRAAGHAAGLAAARAEVDAVLARHERAVTETRSVASTLEAAVAQVQQADRLVLRDMERSVTSMALELAAAIVGREVLLAGSALEAVRAAARLAPERQAVTVRVHPEEAADVSSNLACLHLPNGSIVVPDPAVGRGQCVLDAGNCRIDHQIAGALERMREAIETFYGMAMDDADVFTAQSDSEVAA